MAKEWYLLQTPYNQLSGYESEALDDFAQEGFSEILESNIAIDIKLCNYDLSYCQDMRAVIQNNVQDTKLKTLSRMALLPIGSCKAGMYILYKNRYWLIVGFVDDNTMYEKAIMVLCNYLLTWLNDNNQIIQRWVNLSSASQYNNGETSTPNFLVRSDQLLVVCPDDDECLMLKSGRRFIFDKRCKIYESQMADVKNCDTSKSVITYKITRVDSMLYNYQDSGHYEFMVSQDEQREEDGYYIIDGKGYWLCDVPKEPFPTSKVPSTDDDSSPSINTPYSTIEYESDEIYNGIDYGMFTAHFYDSNGEIVNVSPTWAIDCSFVDQLNIEYVDNSICISVDNDKLINKSFELSVSADGYGMSIMLVTIRAFI